MGRLGAVEGRGGGAGGDAVVGGRGVTAPRPAAPAGPICGPLGKERKNNNQGKCTW